MFTGLVEEIGKVKTMIWGQNSIQISIECKKIIEDIHIGDSIAVNGICLTIVQYSSTYIVADAMPETMNRTNLKGLKNRDEVNLERALRLSDRLGGHMVNGHVDGIGKITHKIKDDNAVILTVDASSEILKHIIEKGSVALDGTSLTVMSVSWNSFKVALIPHTSKVTILGKKDMGETINIECDMFGKYVDRFLKFNPLCPENKQDITEEYLRKNGFM